MLPARQTWLLLVLLFLSFLVKLGQNAPFVDPIHVEPDPDPEPAPVSHTDPGTDPSGPGSGPDPAHAPDPTTENPDLDPITDACGPLKRCVEKPTLIDDNTGDNIKTGMGPGNVKVAYTAEWGARVRSAIPTGKRTAVFYTDQGNRDLMGTYVKNNMNGDGYSFFDVFGMDDSPAIVGGDTKGLFGPGVTYGKNKPQYFLGINRGSRACAQETMGEDTFVMLQSNAGDTVKRSIFDKIVPRRSEEAGVGQVWAQVELPIVVVQQVKQSDGTVKMVKEVQWDITKAGAPPRDSVPLQSLDDQDSIPEITKPTQWAPSTIKPQTPYTIS
ncbi:MAG: hypothetical protein Q9227_009344 [Pyrenula ochraceoflavens]